MSLKGVELRRLNEFVWNLSLLYKLFNFLDTDICTRTILRIFEHLSTNFILFYLLYETNYFKFNLKINKIINSKKTFSHNLSIQLNTFSSTLSAYVDETTPKIIKKHLQPKAVWNEHLTRDNLLKVSTFHPKKKKRSEKILQLLT